MKNLRGLSICLLCLQTYLIMAFDERKICEARQKVELTCDLQGDIEWKKDNQLLVKNTKPSSIKGMPMKVDPRLKISKDSPNLEITKVDISDSGTYTCVRGRDTWTVQLIVLKVEASPSMNLLASEDLTLSVTSTTSLTLSWWKDQKKIKDGPVLKKQGVQTEDSGDYTYRVEISDGSGESISSTVTKRITVNGFTRSPSTVYISGKRPIKIPWTFNFEVRRTPLEKQVRVLGGNLTYSSQMIKRLKVESGAACWEETCDTKTPGMSYNDLSYSLRNPKYGSFQMEIILQLEGRQKLLTREVCVANLTVPASEIFTSLESNVSLRCDINCLEEDKRLCWHHNVMGHKVCGASGQKSFTKNITAAPETLGNWTCSVTSGNDAIVSAILMLKVTPGFFQASNPLLWVVLAVAVLVFLFAMVMITVVTARCRRMRRARYRAWLLENLHQHRVCECNGFAPKRLRENL